MTSSAWYIWQLLSHHTSVRPQWITVYGRPMHVILNWSPHYLAHKFFFSFFRDKQTQLHSVQFSGRRPFYKRVSSGTFVFSTYPVKTTKTFKMCAKMAFTHQPGTAMECLSVCNNHDIIIFSITVVFCIGMQVLHHNR